MRGRGRRPGALGAPGRTRERDPRRAGHVQGRRDPAPDGTGPARGPAGVRRPRGARRRQRRCVRRLQRRTARADGRRERARGRALGDRRSDRAKRRGEGHLDPCARRAAASGKRRERRWVRQAPGPLVRALARPRARSRSRLVPHGVHAPTLPARGDVHEGALGRRLHGDPLPARLRSRQRGEHPARSRRPPAEVSARVRDRLGCARSRPPDHESAGRAPRLSGVPARGRARPPLRRLRSRPSVHVPQPVARPRADRDLLVHPGGDLPRARLARRALRPLGRRGGDQCRGHHFPRCPALSALRGEARLRARVLGPLRRGRRHSGRLLRAPRRGDRCPLPPRCIPRGHGRGLLLGRLPARLDSLRAAARVPGVARSGPSGGDHRRPASGCARSSAKGRARRARRSPLASASIRSTPHRSSPSFRRRVRACLRLPSTGSIGTTS